MIIISNVNFDNNNVTRETKSIKVEESEELPSEIEIKEDIPEEKIISQEIKDEPEIEESLPKVNTNIEDVINIRINNSFANADKKMKSDLENNLSSMIDSAKKDSNIYSLIIDIEVGVVSPTNILFVSDTDASATLLNEKDEIISNLLGIDKKIVFVSKEKWNQLVDDFKKNKGKIKYEYKEEPNIEKTSEIEDLANNIFGDNNIIVEE